MTTVSTEPMPPHVSPPSGNLVAVNVGLPRDVEWRGRTVHTGVWKRPVDGPRLVRTLNIDGDGQGDLGGHGGPHRAVLVYQLGAYEHWRQHFGREDLEPGSFGENFTVDGLPDDVVCIGDQYQIGDAVFEVSQPRVTCYRVGLRLGEPQLPALLVAHGRPGFYLRVLREGTVAAGDPIIKLRTGPEEMTVAEIDALLYLPGHERSGLERALAIPALSPGWQGSFRAMLGHQEGASGNAGLSAAAAEPPAAWAGFRDVVVTTVVRETDSVVSLGLAAVDRQALPAAVPGQFVALRLDLEDGQPPASRSYSLSGPADSSEYRISVKREHDGPFSSFVHSRIQPQAVLQMSAPRGRFTLDAGESPVLLISAGIGATPVLSMLYALVEAESTRDIWWLHGARNSAEHVFAAEVRGLLARLRTAHTMVCYSAPLSTDTMGRDFTRLGRLDAGALRNLPLPPAAQAYVCGPQSFMTDLQIALVELGVDGSRIHTEVFGAGPAVTPGIAARPVIAPHPPVGDPGRGPSVSFARSGLTVPWRDDFISVLELAEACDVPTRWSCRTGVCHTCEAGLLSGKVEYDPAPVDLPADGNVLVCCAVPDTAVVVDM